ncbi:MAG TPA: glycosyltransferase family 4 protein [Steroidobacteraceae bacterium]|nr:glycosyltransferase family 4 protein [Steroidobacteraceae bacterium]
MHRVLPASSRDAGTSAESQAPHAAAAPPAVRVLMLGPDLQVRGGVAMVENAVMAHMPADIKMMHLATMVEGSSWRKLRCFGRALFRTSHHMRRMRPHLVHIHFASRASSVRKMLLARLAMARGARVIMHAHGGGYRDYWASLSRSGRAATLATLRRVDRLIVLGEGWREFFSSLGVDPGRIEVVSNPVALPRALPARLARSQVRLVYLGLIARSKGTFDLIDALAALPPAALARVKLVIAGNGANAELRELIAARGLRQVAEVLDWVGPAERDRLLASADAFVLPSYAEGLPMALLEAMAWGLPVICSDVGSIPEHVHEGVEGILVQPGNIAQLAGAIQQVVQDDVLRTRMGARARAAVEPLSVDVFSRKIAAIYRSVAGVERVAASSAPCTRS